MREINRVVDAPTGEEVDVPAVSSSRLWLLVHVGSSD